MLFYELVNGITFGGGEDFVQSFNADATAGIKLRTAEDVKSANAATRVHGMRKKIAENKNWHCEYFSDSLPDRCYTFRIRTRRNDKGELVEAYYGKIYGDFEFEGDDKKGLIGVKFLYYLNPKSLDRNLDLTALVGVQRLTGLRPMRDLTVASMVAPHLVRAALCWWRRLVLWARGV